MFSVFMNVVVTSVIRKYNRDACKENLDKLCQTVLHHLLKDDQYIENITYLIRDDVEKSAQLVY